MAVWLFAGAPSVQSLLDQNANDLEESGCEVHWETKFVNFNRNNSKRRRVTLNDSNSDDNHDDNSRASHISNHAIDLILSQQDAFQELQYDYFQTLESQRLTPTCADVGMASQFLDRLTEAEESETCTKPSSVQGESESSVLTSNLQNESESMELGSLSFSVQGYVCTPLIVEPALEDSCQSSSGMATSDSETNHDIRTPIKTTIGMVSKPKDGAEQEQDQDQDQEQKQEQEQEEQEQEEHEQEQQQEFTDARSITNTNTNLIVTSQSTPANVTKTKTTATNTLAKDIYWQPQWATPLEQCTTKGKLVSILGIIVQTEQPCHVQTKNGVCQVVNFLVADPSQQHFSVSLWGQKPRSSLNASISLASVVYLTNVRVSEYNSRYQGNMSWSSKIATVNMMQLEQQGQPTWCSRFQQDFRVLVEWARLRYPWFCSHTHEVVINHVNGSELEEGQVVHFKGIISDPPPPPHHHHQQQQHHHHQHQRQQQQQQQYHHPHFSTMSRPTQAKATPRRLRVSDVKRCVVEICFWEDQSSLVTKYGKLMQSINGDKSYDNTSTSTNINTSTNNASTNNSYTSTNNTTTAINNTNTNTATVNINTRTNTNTANINTSTNTNTTITVWDFRKLLVRRCKQTRKLELHTLPKTTALALDESDPDAIDFFNTMMLNNDPHACKRVKNIETIETLRSAKAGTYTIAAHVVKLIIGDAEISTTYDHDHDHNHDHEPLSFAWGQSKQPVSERLAWSRTLFRGCIHCSRELENEAFGIPRVCQRNSCFKDAGVKFCKYCLVPMVVMISNTPASSSSPSSSSSNNGSSVDEYDQLKLEIGHPNKTNDGLRVGSDECMRLFEAIYTNSVQKNDVRVDNDLGAWDQVSGIHHKQLSSVCLYLLSRRKTQMTVICRTEEDANDYEISRQLLLTGVV